MGASQRGVALITVMVVVAIVVSVSASVLSSHYLDIRRAENVLHGNQGIALLLALETWSRQVLLDDEEDNDVDHPGEPWAQTLLPIDADGGVVSGRILDQQGLFNVNNLINADGKVDAVAQAGFLRLLELIEEVEAAEAISDAVIDWLDSDREPVGLGGREDLDYAVLDPSYRTRGGEMISPSELLLVEGISYQYWIRLRPFVTALPKREGQPTALNVNTAPAEVIAAAAGVDLSVASEIVSDVENDPFEEVEAFKERVQGSQGENDADATDFERFTTRSNFFLVESRSRFSDVALGMSHLIERTDDGTRVLGRAIENAW